MIPSSLLIIARYSAIFNREYSLYPTIQGGETMIVFDPLWDTMKRKHISQYTLIKEHGVSTGTLDALRKDRSVTLHTINELCRILRCDVSDIIRYVPDEEEEY